MDFICLAEYNLVIQTEDGLRIVDAVLTVG